MRAFHKKRIQFKISPSLPTFERGETFQPFNFWLGCETVQAKPKYEAQKIQQKLKQTMKKIKQLRYKKEERENKHWMQKETRKQKWGARVTKKIVASKIQEY